MCSKTTIYHHETLLAAKRKNIVSDATTTLRMNIDREISRKHVLMDFVTVFILSRLK